MTRTCPPALVDYFKFKICDPQKMDPDELLVSTAIACSGVTEVGGENRGRLVELFQTSVNRPEGQSWCLDFVQACIAYVEAVKGIQSPLIATEGCMDLWQKSAAANPERPGDVVIWQFGTAWQGHCGILISRDLMHYHTIEGNTSPSREQDSAEVRNGDGVYFKNRPVGGMRPFIQKGFVRPFP